MLRVACPQSARKRYYAYHTYIHIHTHTYPAYRTVPPVYRNVPYAAWAAHRAGFRPSALSPQSTIERGVAVHDGLQEEMSLTRGELEQAVMQLSNAAINLSDESMQLTVIASALPAAASGSRADGVASARATGAAGTGHGTLSLAATTDRNRAWPLSVSTGPGRAVAFEVHCVLQIDFDKASQLLLERRLECMPSPVRHFGLARGKGCESQFPKCAW